MWKRIWIAIVVLSILLAGARTCATLQYQQSFDEISGSDLCGTVRYCEPER